MALFLAAVILNPSISVHLVVPLCRCRCSTSFPKEAGSLDHVDAFRTGLGFEKHRVLVVRQPEIALFPTLHTPLVPKIFRLFGSGSGFQQSNRQQAIPISAALEGPGCPRLRHGYSKLPATGCLQ